MSVSGGEAQAAAEREAPPPGLWQLPVMVLVLSALFVAGVWLLSFWLTEAERQAPHPPKPAAVVETCDFAGVEDVVVRLRCPSGPRRALVADVRQVPGVAAAAARAALSAGLSAYVALAEGTTVRCDRLASSPPSARCVGETGELARFLVETGAAGADAPELGGTELAAQEARTGLHADAHAALVDRRVLIQTWLATAIGLAGAVAGFLYNARQSRHGWALKLQERKSGVERALTACNRHYNEWLRSPQQQADAFAAALRALRAEIVGFDVRREWAPAQCDRIDQIIRVIEGMKSDTRIETGGVESAWNAVNAAVKAKTGSAGGLLGLLGARA